MSEPLVPPTWAESAAHTLAELLAERRTGGSVFMCGTHNPLPTEHFAAGQFIAGLIASGWTPPAEEPY